MPRNCRILVNIKPIGPWPATSTASPGNRFRRLHGFEDGVDGFEHGALFKRIFGRDFDDAGQDRRA